MKQIFTLVILILLCSSNLSSQILWTGSGDAISWEDPLNWDGNVVPSTGDLVEIASNVVISGTSSSDVAQIKIKSNVNVTLDLDLTVGGAVEHAIVINSNCSLTLGTPNSNKTFVLNPDNTKDAIAIFGGSADANITVELGNTLNVASGNNGLNVAAPTATLNNNGTIIISGVNNGIKLGGVGTNTGTITLNSASSNGLQLLAGSFNNAVSGTITINSLNDDGITISDVGTFSNSGTINGTANPIASSGNNPIYVENGSFINLAQGSVTLDGGLSSSTRIISVDELGKLTNSGNITLSAGDDRAILYNRGETINDLNGIIDFSEGRGNVNAGTLTNNGLLISTRSSPGLFTGSNGTSINNAFYNYSNSNLFSNGAGNITNNGIDINNASIDALEACEIDLAETPYEWYDGSQLLGTASATGLLVVPDNTVVSGNPVTLSTTIPGVTVSVINFCAQPVIEITPDVFVWDGGGDGTSWDDPANWDNDIAPASQKLVEITKDVTITSVSPLKVSQIRIAGKSNVTLDLDLEVGGSDEHAIIIGSESSLTIGNNEVKRTIKLSPSSEKHGINISDGAQSASLQIAKKAELRITSGNAGLNIINAESSVVNDGSIYISNVNNGLKVQSSFANNGLIYIESAINKGIITQFGNFYNRGSISSVSTENGALAVQSDGTFTNAGAFTVINQESKGISIGTGSENGTFYNYGRITGGSTIPLTLITVEKMGNFRNGGQISFWGDGNPEIIISRGQFVNEFLALLRLNNVGLSVKGGVFTNNGLITSSINASGINIGSSAKVINNAFFKYENSNVFAEGNGEIIDLGLDANNAFINAGGACSIDLAEAPYTWKDDGQLVGKATDQGLLTIPENLKLSGNPLTLKTSYSQVEVVVSNLCLDLTSTWDGEGDGTSWEDPLNWDGDELPIEGALVEIGLDANITGTVVNQPSQIKVNANTDVVLDLDLTIGGDTVHAITIGPKANLTLGTDTTSRAFNLSTLETYHGINITGGSDSSSIVIAEGSTVNIIRAQTAINVIADSSKVVNNGTITVIEANNGMKISGSFQNNGVLTLLGIDKVAVNVEKGSFTNTGSLTSEKAGKDGIDVNSDGAFTNSGIINITVKDDAGNNDVALVVGLLDESGFFINEATGIINADGGIDSSSRVIYVSEMGELQNFGTINFSGGDDKARLYTRGITVNGFNGILNLNDGRINVNQGTLTNNGLIKTVRPGAGLFVAPDAFAINNAFFDYSSGNKFSSGAGMAEDNGINVNNNNLNAEKECSIDIAETPYEWFDAGISIGTATDEGLLSIAEDVVLSSNPVVLTTSLPGVSVSVSDFCIQDVVVESDFVWDGGGDGTSWEDAANWNNDMIPNESSYVLVDIDATITGNAEMNPAQILIGNNAKVELDLDLTIGGDTFPALMLHPFADLTLGNDLSETTVVLAPDNVAHAIQVSGDAAEAKLTIAQNTTVNISGARTGINLINENAILENKGSIQLEAANNGVKLSGTIINAGSIALSGVDKVAVNIEGGTFKNEGDLTVNKPGKEGITITEEGSFSNSGILNVNVKDNALTADEGILVGTSESQGTFTNELTGVVHADGGLDTFARSIYVDELGSLFNHGTINVISGDDMASFYNRGSTRNEMNAIINTNNGRLNINRGTFVNDGLITSTREAPGLFVGPNGTATNNAFYKNEISSKFSSGGGISEDHGIDLNDANFDGMKSCSVDLAERPYEWFDGDISLGFADDTGLLSIGQEVALSSNPVELSTTIPGVVVQVTDFCDEEIVNVEKIVFRWDGGGDGTSWSDAANWEKDTFPSALSSVVFPIDAVVTGMLDHNPAQVKIGDSVTVVLDLDLSIGGDTIQTLIMNKMSHLTLGSDDSFRSFVLAPSSEENAINIGMNSVGATLSIAPSTAVNVNFGLNAINVANEMTTIMNAGDIRIKNTKNGIKSASVFNNEGQIIIESVSAKSLFLKGGVFTNDGSIVISSEKDAATLDGDATFINNGMITMSTDDGIIIGTEEQNATFVNAQSGEILINSGLNQGLGIDIKDKGNLINSGYLTLTSVSNPLRLTSSGQILNQEGAYLDLGNGKIDILADTLVNAGLILSSYSGSAINTMANGTSINQAFFKYLNSDIFSSGTGQVIDNGIDLNDPLETTIDAGELCDIDLANATYEWFESEISIGNSSSEGGLSLLPHVFGTDTIVLTNIYPEVAITVVNFCPEAISSVFDINLEVSQVLVYPSPLQRGMEFNVDLTSYPSEGMDFEIFDLNGKRISSLTLFGGNVNQITMDNLSTGIYILKHEYAEGILLAKFTIL